MIRKISFQNYKAFEKGEIKLKPITILLGANSVGKSSVINLILTLQQTANSTNYKSALRLHGENVSMGECKNIFRNQDISKNLTIDIEFENDKLKYLLREELFNQLINQITQPFQYYFHFSDISSNKQKNDIKSVFNKRGEIDIKTKEDFINLITNIEKLNKDIAKTANKQSDDRIAYFLRKNTNTINEKETVKLLYDFLSETKKIEENIFSWSFELCYVTLDNIDCRKKEEEENILKINRLSLTNKGKQVINIKLVLSKNKTEYNDIIVTSDFINKEEILDKKAKEEFLKMINYNSTIFSWAPRISKNRDFLFRDINDVENSILTQTISQIIEQSITSIKSRFTRELVNHVSPLRAHPKRYYFLDKANINTVLDTFDGNSLTEILKENEKVKNQVNKWLKTFGLLHVDVSTLQDVIHKLKIKQYSLDLDITDVGFGISQILPIIVQGFWSEENSLTMIEQPEIHLHPKMQADLADLFIDIVGINTEKSLFDVRQSELPKKCLIIETHSEYLLKRLRRRISEGKISAQDIAIYFIEPPKNKNISAKIEEIKISEEGAFDWPQDFYEGELKKDNTNFIKQLFSQK